jgi:membrane-anchored protein YejM (alkaline phosphatase superfamily)
VERRASEVVNHALGWLQQAKGRAVFLWVHFYDAHDPYDPPEPFKSRYKSDPYDGEIAYVDAQLGRFLSCVAHSGPLRQIIYRVMADHGESLGEHGENTHGVFCMTPLSTCH